MRGIRTKRVRTVKEDTLIVTVDIGMTSNTGYCATVDGRDIKPFKFENTREGLDKLWSMVVMSRNRINYPAASCEVSEVTIPICNKPYRMTPEQAPRNVLIQQRLSFLLTEACYWLEITAASLFMV